jgi:NADH-quinone oxidoreductase subunit J
MYSTLFFIFAGCAVGFAVNLLIQRNPIYSALSLIGAMSSLASLYVMLGAEFVAVVQVIIYGGAIVVLSVFVLLLNRSEPSRIERSRLVGQVGPPLIVMLLGLFVTVVYREFPEDAMARGGDYLGQTAGLGLRVFLTHLLPFEVTSILILIAVIGAVVLGRGEA